MFHAHLQAMLEHDIDRIGEKEFTLEGDIALHLLVDGMQ